jgi:membrane-bound serine protease (ClpP class)
MVQVMDAQGEIVTATVQVEGAPLTENDPTFFEELLYIIADPNIAFLLLSLGGLALIAEIFTTNGVTGIFGVIALVLAFFALGALPTNWAGVALILFGLVLITAEVFVAGFGVLGIGGIIAIAFGGLILTGSSDTGFQVSRWLVIGFAVAAGALVIGLGGLILKARKMPVHSGRESLVGAKGTARSKLDPRGAVLVEGERWDAITEDAETIDEDTPIIVTRSEGFLLYVQRDPAFIKLLPAAQTPEA